MQLQASAYSNTAGGNGGGIWARAAHSTLINCISGGNVHDNHPDDIQPPTAG